MKRYILLLGFLFAPSLKAHIFAYQDWFNPKTEQTLEVYYDLHHPNTNEAIRKQQPDFIERAHKNNATVLVEDMWSFGDSEKLHLNDSVDENKLHVYNHITTYPSPRILLWLHANCVLNDIPVYNIECREGDHSLPLTSKYQQELDLFDDGILLNTFYASRDTIAQKLTALEGKQSYGINFNRRLLSVDSRALHTIHTTTAKNIMLAAGAIHIMSINNVLLQLGWIPGALHVPSTLQVADRCAVLRWIQVDEPQDHATLLSTFFNNYYYAAGIIQDQVLDIAALSNSRCPHNNVLTECFFIAMNPYHNPMITVKV